MPGFIRAFGRAHLGGQILELMEENHPEEPHWYLMIIGTDPTVRGARFRAGADALRLDRCDAEHAPAYLEASKPELVPYYSRFGFEVTGEIKLPDGGPNDVAHVAWRQAR